MTNGFDFNNFIKSLTVNNIKYLIYLKASFMIILLLSGYLQILSWKSLS